MSPVYTRLAVATLLASLIACVPTHTVKPLPDFVSTGLGPGDRVTVTTTAGDVHEFEITEIRENKLIGHELQFELQALMSIKKHAWTRPESPCGGEKPLGCSVPLLVAIASEAHSHYEGKFYDACAQHDYCYRHGFTSYGKDRKACDDAFFEDMKALCPKAAVNKLGRVLQAVDGSLDSRQTCLSVAEDYYGAVRRYGEKKYLTKDSTLCAYDGPSQLLKRKPASEQSATTSESPVN